jgi:hypothetical protein
LLYTEDYLFRGRSWYTCRVKQFIASLAFLLLLPLSVHAQATADVSMTLIPSNPKPGETVRVMLQSYATDLSKSLIVWRYGERVVDSGIGKTALSIVAPASGQVALLSATASIPNGDPVTVSNILRPASIDVLWEAFDSYTPPFYKGKALPSTNGQIRITAIPGASAPKNVSYVWKRGDTILQNASGYNRSTFSFTNSELSETELVSATGSGGIWNGIGSVSIPIISPSLIGYPMNGGYIDYANGSTNQLQAAGGIDIKFEPYYFSVPTSIERDVQIGITSGEESIDTSGGSILRLSRPENGTDATLSIRIDSIASALQRLTRAFTVSFY